MEQQWLFLKIKRTYRDAKEYRDTKKGIRKIIFDKFTIIYQREEKNKGSYFIKIKDRLVDVVKDSKAVWKILQEEKRLEVREDSYIIL